jgi:hypothetical protein
MNTVMRTLGGAFGAAIAAECLALGGSLDGDFALAFAICAGALTLGVGAVLAIPGKGSNREPKVALPVDERMLSHPYPIARSAQRS